MTNKLTQLELYLKAKGPVAVAVSGGVDSMTLGVISHRTDPATVLYHAISPAVPEQATRRVKHYAKLENWQLEIINAGEIEDPRYIENPVNRCYYCKTNLYDAIASRTDLPIVSGTNTDDLGDYRPGLNAAAEHQVLHPYVETGVSKQELREIARSLGLDDLHDLPAAPCLSSRVTTGIPINPELLPLVNLAERHVWDQIGNRNKLNAVRCRIRPGEVVLEIDATDSIEDDSKDGRLLIQSISQLFQEAGFHDYAKSVSIEPYRMGSAFLIEAVQVD
jgi:uncharacterized protein